MRHDLVQKLRCPYTGSPLETAFLWGNGCPCVEYGVLKSAAGEFPVIAGILRFLSDELQMPLVRLIKEGLREEALVMAIELPYRDKWSTIVNRLSRNGQANRSRLIKRLVSASKKTLLRKLVQPVITFQEFARTTNKNHWERWQTYRFSMPAFLSVHAWSVLAKNHDKILDFGCGMGQSSFLINRINPAALIVCADYSFTSLYLSKRFVLSDAEYICLDGDYGVPFMDNFFDLVFSTDTLQYIEGKIGLAREFQRVLSEDGLVVLPHLHNRLSSVQTGKSLEPMGYDGLFADVNRCMYPEDKIVADYVTDGTLHLEYRSTPEETNEAVNGLSLIAARSEAPFHPYSGLWDSHIDSMVMPRINPAYRLGAQGPNWVMQRRIGLPYVMERMVGDCTVLPDSWTVKTKSVDSVGLLALRRGERKELYELLRRFLVLEMPQEYLMPAGSRA